MSRLIRSLASIPIPLLRQRQMDVLAPPAPRPNAVLKPASVASSGWHCARKLRRASRMSCPSVHVWADPTKAVTGALCLRPFWSVNPRRLISYRSSSAILLAPAALIMTNLVASTRASGIYGKK